MTPFAPVFLFLTVMFGVRGYEEGGEWGYQILSAIFALLTIWTLDKRQERE